MRLPDRKRRSYEAKPAPPQSGRTVDNSKLYNGRRWRKFRANYLARNPLCEECKKEDKITPATVLDHKIQVRSGGAPYDEFNVQGLCNHHHAVKSGRERHAARGHRGSKP